MLFLINATRTAALRSVTASTTVTTRRCARRCFATTTYYTPAHEYIKVDNDNEIGTCGITDFAQSALGDIVFCDLPEVGDTFDAGDAFGSVESVKAASDVYAPVGGTITEINDKLADEPALVNTDAEGDAWFMKLQITDTTELEGLMDEEKYKAHCAKEDK